MEGGARMELRQGLHSSMIDITQIAYVVRTRVKCSFPVVIKGFNRFGERYDEIALVEDIGWRGLCFRTAQSLLPGSIITLYHSEDELDPVGNFEVVWAKSSDSNILTIGLEIIGDNAS